MKKIGLVSLGWVLMALMMLGTSALVNGQEESEKAEESVKEGKSGGEKEGKSGGEGEVKSGYEKFIAQDAIRQEGLFDVITIKKNYYFEISDEMLNRDMLLGERVSELSSSSKVAAGEMRKAPVLIRFTRDDDNVYMHRIISAYSADKDDPVNIAVKRTSIDPIMHTFKVEALNEDSTAAVIDVTKFYSGEISAISPFNAKYKAGKLEAEPTRILEAMAFEKNIEVRTYMSYSNTSGNPFSIVTHRSLLLLPEEPMRPRYEDPRIGYFSDGRVEFSTDTIGVNSIKFIHRFKLEPKAGDWDKFMAGELVEPAKPIIFYIDDAFPAEWREYIKAGVEDWQGPFEAIGFRNAIIAKDYPSDDPTFHPEDIRYSCVRYISSPKANSMGPRWIDPRSGEVIGGDMLWWHNVTELLRDWRFVQTAAADPKARERNLDLDVLGPMIRYVAAHELGHVLGLKHNMRASFAFPVDSLRSPSFTAKNGTTPSIMDYARFNYIAQPGDGVENFLPPHMGPYDYYAIGWGYRPIPGNSSPEEEYETLNAWILEKSGDPVYQYGDQQMGAPSQDPSSQNEALGDDVVKASTYGVKNLKFIMEHLAEWTVFENENFEYLNHMYEQVIKQYERYIGHVVSNISGLYIYKAVGGEDIPYYTPLSRKAQQDALDWLFKELSTQSEWLINEDVEQRMASKKPDLMKSQAATLDKMMNAAILQRLFTYHTEYSCEAYLDDLHAHIWEKTLGNEKLDEFERHLQASYVRNLLAMPKEGGIPASRPDNPEELSSPNGSKTPGFTNIVEPLVYQKIRETEELLKKKLKQKDPVMAAHYHYLYDLVRK